GQVAVTVTCWPSSEVDFEALTTVTGVAFGFLRFLLASAGAAPTIIRTSTPMRTEQPAPLFLIRAHPTPPALFRGDQMPDPASPPRSAPCGSRRCRRSHAHPPSHRCRPRA